MFTENLLFYKEESLIMAFIDTIKERAKEIGRAHV